MKRLGIDSHAHLDFDQFDDDREKVIERAKNQIEYIVNPGADPKHNKKAYELSEKYPDFISFNTGLHPVYTDKFDKLDVVKKQIEDFQPDVIGEIGLDHHHVTDKRLRRRQREVFEELLSIAENKDKNVVLHTRDAEEKVLDLLESYSIKGVFLHCFNGSKNLAQEAVDRGYNIGVTTQVLYSSEVQELVKDLGLENILLETDSPYLYRGDRNEPVNIRESAEKIAEIKSVDKKVVLETSSQNSKKFFNL